MKKLRCTIKTNAERLPFIMVLIAAVCYLCAYTDIYFYGYDLLQNTGDVSLLFCFFMYGFSGKWGFIAMKSLYTLVALNILNIINMYFVVENYYFYFIGFIYACFITLIVYSKCRST